jgi:molybdopterin adenylyltransferase
MRAAVITVSSSIAAGSTDEDESGCLLRRWVSGMGLEIAGGEVLPDDPRLIADRLRHWAETEGCALIATTGGTGFTISDVTPEATRAVIERDAPGIAEAIRAASREHTPHWMLSRAIAGIRGTTLIVNFPGNPRAIEQAADALSAALPHGLRLLTDPRDPHG